MFDVGGKTWKSYNWSMVTTVATFGKYDAELMCYAHSKGARVVLKGRGSSLQYELMLLSQSIVLSMTSGFTKINMSILDIFLLSTGHRPIVLIIMSISLSHVGGKR